MKICHVFLFVPTTDMCSVNFRVTCYERREKKNKLWVRLRRERWLSCTIWPMCDVRTFVFISTTQYVIQTPNIIILVFHIAPEMTSTSCKPLKRAMNGPLASVIVTHPLLLSSQSFSCAFKSEIQKRICQLTEIPLSRLCCCSYSHLIIALCERSHGHGS